jgi:signal transduction histidine kinase
VLNPLHICQLLACVGCIAATVAVPGIPSAGRGIILALAVAATALSAAAAVRAARSRYALGVLARAGHDFRTPLSVLAGVADALRDPSQRPEAAAAKGDVVERQVRRMTALVDGSVGAAARAVGGAARARVSALGPCVVRSAVPGPGLMPLQRSLDDIAAAADPSADVRLCMDASGAEGLSSRAYDERFFFIASNLARNALEHGVPNVRPILRPWEVHLSVSCPEPAVLRLVVEDEGPGLRLSPITRAPRSQAASAPGRPRAGRRAGGLGLFIVRELAAGAGGCIRFESPYAAADGVRRHGCRVTVDLPVAGGEDRR